jgi:diacylglycerol kinase family enzyme
VVIANPRSGGGKVESSGLVAVAAEHGIEVVLMTEGDDLRRLALAAVERGADALGMAGGDGSLAVVAQVAVDHDLPFVVVPAGTRNHYAGDLGLDRADPAQALAAFVRGEEHRLDFATVNERMFLNNVSLGVYAAAVEQPEYRDAKLETTLKLLPDLVAKGGPCFDLRIDVPGAGHWDGAALVQVSNGAYEMSGAAFGRRLQLDSGQLGVVAVDVNHGADLAAITVLAAARQVERHAGVWPWVTTELTIGSGQRHLPVGVDGEHVVLEPPLRFRAVSRGLRVLVPEGTAVGLANQHLGAQGTVGGLLEVAFNLGGSSIAD